MVWLHETKQRTVCSSWSTAEDWLTEINHWEYYTNQPSTPMVSQEAGGHHALLMAINQGGGCSTEVHYNALVLHRTREAGCFREVAVLYSDHLRQVPV